MPKESKSALRARAQKIAAILADDYPEATTALDHKSAFELLIATILAAQCTDARVNQISPELFRRWPDAQAMSKATQEEMEVAVKSTGFYRNKAKNIQTCGRKLVALHGGTVPRTMAELTHLDGVGRKTANVVLGNAFNLNEGVVVDTHVARLSARLGLTTETTPEKIELALQPLVPRQDWTLFSHWLIWHGRRRCSARKPDCAHCEIRQLCPAVGLVKT